MRRARHRLRYVSVALLMALIAKGGIAQVVGPPSPNAGGPRPGRAEAANELPNPQQQPAHVADRLIVKFKTEGPNRMTLSAEEIGIRALPQAPPVERQRLQPYRSLFELNSESKLRSAQPLWPRPDVPAGQAIATRAASEADLVRDVNAKFTARARRAPKASGKSPELSSYFILDFEPGADLESLRKGYLAHPSVESVEYDNLIPLDMVTPTDPFYATSGTWGQQEDDLWGLKKMRLETAWEVSQGEGVIVAVLDTGVDYTHKDIDENIWINPGEVPANGQDDDRNGFVDDVRGWDFYYNDADPTDGFGHGTHVAGTIAAEGNNSEGIIGVAPKAKVMVLKGCPSGPNHSNAAMTQALLYAINNGADVANCSWGPKAGSLSFSPFLEDTIRLANRVGMVVVFAAGNEGKFMTHASLRNLPEVLAVGASTPDDGLTDFSNLGPRVGVVAPGGGRREPNRDVENILSLKASIIGDSHPYKEFVVKDNYLRMAGTSMAAPHVSGLVALILAKRPDFTIDDVVTTIKASCDDVGDPGFDMMTGYGRVNAASALELERPLQVRITSPADQATLGGGHGTLAVMGTVAGAKLKDWRLVYSPLNDLARQEPIGSIETAPRDGVLQSWDVSSLPTGPYLLSLFATDLDGRTYYDCVTVGRTALPIKMLANDDRLRSEAAVSGGRVVWVESSLASEEEESTIELLDIKTGQRQRVADLAPAFARDIDLEGDWLIHDLRSRDQDLTEQVAIVLRNLQSGSIEKLATFPSGHLNSKIALGGGRVYWTDESDTIFVRHLTRGGPPQSLNQTSSGGLNADGDYLVWSDGLDVFGMNVPTGSVVRLSQDGSTETGAATGFHNELPSIQGGRVAWVRAKVSRDSMIMTYDLRAGVGRIVARNRPDVTRVFVSGSRIYWDDRSIAQQDVSMASVNGAHVALLTGDMANESVVACEGNQVFTLTQRRTTDADTGRLVFDLGVIDVSTPAAFQGAAHRQEGVSYTSTASPDGRALTLLFDNFECELASTDDRLTVKKDVALALPFRDFQQETSVRLVLRGACTSTSPGCSATLIALAGGKPFAFELTGTDGDFLKEMDVTAPAGTSLTLSLWLALNRASPKTGDALLVLDSVDLAFGESP